MASPTLLGSIAASIAALSGNQSVDITSLGLAAGDFLIVSLVTGNTTTDIASGQVSVQITGETFTEDANLYADDTNDTNAFCFSARLVAAQTAVVIGANPALGGIPVTYFIRAYRGVHATTPRDVAVVANTGINGSRPDPTAITPITANAKIVAFYFARQGTSGAWTAPTNMSNFQQASGGATFGRVGCGDADWTSGAFDPAAVTGATTSTSDSNAFVVYALRPLASGGNFLAVF